MIGAVLVYSNRGELIVSKLYKTTLKRSVADIFRVQVINNQDIRSPILTLGSTTFHSIRSSSKDKLWLVTVSRNNCNSAAIWEFLYKLNDAMSIYGINSELTLMEDFMICHELLNVMLMPDGIPNDTDLASITSKMSSKPKESLQSADLYSNHNNTNNHNNKKILNTGNDAILGGTLPSPTTAIPKLLKRVSTISPTSTNKDFIIKKNEIILQLIERINLLVSKDGSILKSYVDGVIECNSRMNGTPTSEITLNDIESTNKNNNNYHRRDTPENIFEMDNSSSDVVLQDFKFHQCVSFEEFDKDRIIQFAPPEGKIELMKYHIKDNLNLPFKITPIVSNTSTGAMDYRIKVKSLFPTKLSAKQVSLKIPVPPGTLDCKISVSNGHCQFVPEESSMIWTFNKYNGLTEDKLSAITVPTNEVTQLTLQQWQRPPLSLNFEILMFSNSGLKISNFNVADRNRKYRVAKWVKYVSQAGSYEIRY